MDDVVLAACCDLDRDRAEAFAATWRIPRVYNRVTDMLDAEHLDGVSVTTPDASHAEIAVAAIEAGVAVFCEKPMASSLDGARRMVAALDGHPVVNMVNYSKRDFPAVRGVKDFIEEGKAGTIRHVETSYLQGWLSSTDWESSDALSPGRLWRLSATHGSAGVLGDLGSHILDLSSFLCGDISEIFCRLETYDKPVAGNRIGDYLLDANDSVAATVRFSGGAVGTLHTTRWATGYKNREFIRLYGDRATVEMDAEVSQGSYRFRAAADGTWQAVDCPPTPTNAERFVASIRTGENDAADFRNGLRVQTYLDACVRSHELSKPVSC
jgi:predicted dehydrogenase